MTDDPNFTATFIMGMACATILWMGVFAWAFMRAPRSMRRSRNRVTKSFGEDV